VFVFSHHECHVTCNTHNCLLFHTTYQKTNVYNVISNLPAVFHEQTVCTTARPMLSTRCLSCLWCWLDGYDSYDNH